MYVLMSLHLHTLKITQKSQVVLLEWRDPQGFCVIRGGSEGIKNVCQQMLFGLEIPSAEGTTVTGCAMCTVISYLRKQIIFLQTFKQLIFG